LEIAAGIFAAEELGDRDFTSGVIQEAEPGQLWAKSFQLVMNTGVQKQHLALPSARQAALAMPGERDVCARRRFRLSATAGGECRDREKSRPLHRVSAEMSIVAACIMSSCQLQDTSRYAFGQTAWAGPAATESCQSGYAALAIASLERLAKPRRKIERLRRSGTPQVRLDASRNHGHSL
jgi:hypothetical protein